MTPEQKQLIREKFKSLKTLDGLDAEAVLAGDGTLLSEWIINELDLAIKQTEERLVEKIEEMIQEELSAKPSGETEETAEWYKVSALKNIITLIRNK